MKTYTKIYIELTEEEKNTLINAYKLLNVLYLNNDSQEDIDEHICNEDINLGILVDAFADIISYLGS